MRTDNETSDDWRLFHGRAEVIKYRDTTYTENTTVFRSILFATISIYGTLMKLYTPHSFAPSILTNEHRDHFRVSTASESVLTGTACRCLRYAAWITIDETLSIAKIRGTWCVLGIVRHFNRHSRQKFALITHFEQIKFAIYWGAIALRARTGASPPKLSWRPSWRARGWKLY